VAVRETGDQGEQEGVGLAGTGATPAKNIASGEGVGKSRGLDRGRPVDAKTSQDVAQARGHAQV
jgi:hypothetical protein